MCKTDADCPSGLACIADKCQDPCIVLKPCGIGAECRVHDTGPWRTMVCICPPGFVSNDERGCERGQYFHELSFGREGVPVNLVCFAGLITSFLFPFSYWNGSVSKRPGMPFRSGLYSWGMCHRLFHWSAMRTKCRMSVFATSGYLFLHTGFHWKSRKVV